MVIIVQTQKKNIYICTYSLYIYINTYIHICIWAACRPADRAGGRAGGRVASVLHLGLHEPTQVLRVCHPIAYSLMKFNIIEIGNWLIQYVFTIWISICIHIYIYIKFEHYMLNMWYHIIPIRYVFPTHIISTFPKNQPSSLGCIFERYSPLFELVILLCFWPNLYTRMCVSTLVSCLLW